MSRTPRYLAPMFIAVAAAITLAPTATTDPDIDGESAAAVVDQLREEGFDVTVNGLPSGDTSLLTTCVVTTIHNPGDPSSDPTTTSPVSVDIACPIQHA
ncbi:hypothetical protein [Mycolicibacterium sediminis]|uniref:PASTA domain-containing protein n=1 Tax=Mycolicibacterium sediminis TaxID=1286180 RepID=A0A7I7QXM5_9MYCO|nr:hypothetical protein [Mycolicibacterium sediminis]BBY31091.1 hypothetical protein MSEDJ_51870 [Mycolicibacterium sediminis]